MFYFFLLPYLHALIFSIFCFGHIFSFSDFLHRLFLLRHLFSSASLFIAHGLFDAIFAIISLLPADFLLSACFAFCIFSRRFQIQVFFASFFQSLLPSVSLLLSFRFPPLAAFVPH